MTLVLNGTTGVSSVDGSASTPAIQGSDSNTGMFFPAADTIAFAEGGAEVARFDSSGNFGIGTSSPGAKLDVNGPASVTSFTGTTRLGVTVRGSSGATDYSGIDFIGGNQVNPLARIAVLSTGGGSFLSFGTSNSYASGITSTAVSIDPNGNFLFGSTSTASPTLYYIKDSSGGYFAKNANTTGATTAYDFLINGTRVGAITTSGSNTSYATSSDYRLKEDVQPMTGALAKVAALKPVTYKWKVDGSDGEGFIAHELQAVVPGCVIGEKDAVDEDGNINPQGIDTSFLVATLTAAIQELKAELDGVKAELATLKGQA